MIDVEVAYATAENQVIVALTLPERATVAEAINASGLMQQFSELCEGALQVGLFSKPCSLDQGLVHGDRVEIYRPLLNDPKDARRLRAVKKTGVTKK
jgi:uncharacterized protein